MEYQRDFPLNGVAPSKGQLWRRVIAGREVLITIEEVHATKATVLVRWSVLRGQGSEGAAFREIPIKDLGDWFCDGLVKEVPATPPADAPDGPTAPRDTTRTTTRATWLGLPVTRVLRHLAATGLDKGGMMAAARAAGVETSEATVGVCYSLGKRKPDEWKLALTPEQAAELGKVLNATPSAQVEAGESDEEWV